MKKRKVKICIWGSGRAGLVHTNNFANCLSCSEVTAIVDSDKPSLEAVCDKFNVENRFTDYKQALSNCDFDAVVIATPAKCHKEMVIAAANAGKHILCEKPMAMSVEECDEMIKAVEKNKVKLQIGFMRRFDKNFIAAKEKIAQGEIGNVVMVRSLTYGPSTPKPWMYDISKSNGPLSEVNSHDIDTLRWYTESEFKEVYAIAGNYRSIEAKKQFPDFYDNVILNASFINGMQGLISGAQGVRYGYDTRCEILGTKGIIFVGALEECSVVSCSVNGMHKPIVRSWVNLFENAYLAEAKHFVECVMENKQPSVTGYDGRQAVNVVNAGNKSIREKVPVKLDE